MCSALSMPTCMPNKLTFAVRVQTQIYISSSQYLARVQAKEPAVQDIQLAEFQDHDSPPINFDSAGVCSPYDCALHDIQLADSQDYKVTFPGSRVQASSCSLQSFRTMTHTPSNQTWQVHAACMHTVI